MASSENGSGG
jgi:hypothetical protein